MDDNTSGPNFTSGRITVTNTSSSGQEPASSLMTGWLIKLSGGAIKSEKAAEYILVGFSIVAILFSLFLAFGTKATPPQPSAAQLQYGGPNNPIQTQ